MSKAAAEKTPASSDKAISIFTHVFLALVILCIILALVLFAGAMDLGVVDLRPAISGFSIIILPIFAVFALIAVFSQMKVAHLRATSLFAKGVEIETLVNETTKSVEAKIQEFLGAEHERLKAEHQKMSEFLKELEKQEQERLVEELETLKAENTKLKERLSVKNVPLNDELSAIDELDPTGT